MRRGFYPFHAVLRGGIRAPAQDSTGFQRAHKYWFLVSFSLSGVKHDDGIVPKGPDLAATFALTVS